MLKKLSDSPLLRRLQFLTVTIVFAACSYRWFALTNKYAVNVFFGDQWDFNDATVFENHSLWQIFRWQWGPHRQGLGGLLAKLIEPSLRWNTRYEAFGVVIILSLATLLALWLKIRLFGALEVFDVVIPLFFLTPIQWEVFFLNLNISHGPLPVLLLMAYELCLTIEDRLWRYAILLPINFVLINTGFGLLMGLLTPGVIGFELWRTDESRVLPYVALAVSILSLASFFVRYRYFPATPCFTPMPEHPFRYPLFIAFLLATFVGVFVRETLVPAVLAGMILLAIFCIAYFCLMRNLIRDRENTRRQLIICSLATYAGFFVWATAYGRACIGLSQAQESRYSTYLIVAFFALYLGALSTKVRLERNVFVLVVLGAAMMSSLHLHAVERNAIADFSYRKRVWKECYLAKHDDKLCEAETESSITGIPGVGPDPRKLELLRERGWNLYADANGH